MPAPKNLFKEAITSGEVQVGCWLGLGNAYTAELMTTTGFDWLLIDGEHGPNDLRSIRDQLQVVEPSPSKAVVRLPIGETWMVKQYLDIGAQTLLVPMIETAEQAKQMVAACRYPPSGVRGVGSYLARASQFGGIPDYLTTADEQICLIVQAESKRALENLDEILAVDGVDGVFIGPSDLSASMGHIGKPGTPEVQEAITDGIKRIAASGKAAGVLQSDLEVAHKYVDLGASFIAIGIDTALLAFAARDLAERGKALAKRKE